MCDCFTVAGHRFEGHELPLFVWPQDQREIHMARHSYSCMYVSPASHGQHQKVQVPDNTRAASQYFGRTSPVYCYIAAQGAAFNLDGKFATNWDGESKSFYTLRNMHSCYSFSDVKTSQDNKYTDWTVSIVIMCCSPLLLSLLSSETFESSFILYIYIYIYIARTHPKKRLHVLRTLPYKIHRSGNSSRMRLVPTDARSAYSCSRPSTSPTRPLGPWKLLRWYVVCNRRC